MRTYQDTWNHRCKILFCCMGRSDQYKVCLMSSDGSCWAANLLKRHKSFSSSSLIVSLIILFFLFFYWRVVCTGFFLWNRPALDRLFSWLGSSADGYCGRPRLAQETTEKASRDSRYPGNTWWCVKGMLVATTIVYRQNVQNDSSTHDLHYHRRSRPPSINRSSVDVHVSFFARLSHHRTHACE